MPFTPFHLMAGTSVKSLFPKYFSFSIFTLTNIIIDSEVLYYMYTTGIPSHKFFHTFLGVSLIAIFVALFCRSFCEIGLKLWNIILYTKKFSLFKVEVKITTISAWCGAFVGAYSQLLLDSIMHRDMMPFFPISDLNQLHSIISTNNLHYLCIGLFYVAFAIFVLRSYIRMNKSYKKY